MHFPDQDDLSEDPDRMNPSEEENLEEELTGEELEKYRQHRLRILFNAGNLSGILTGSVLILLLVALLLSMVNFVMKDLSHSFSLFQIKF